MQLIWTFYVVFVAAAAFLSDLLWSKANTHTVTRSLPPDVLTHVQHFNTCK